MMVFSNALQKAPAVTRATALAFLQVLAPFAPHIAEELWSRRGAEPSILRAPWPHFDTARLTVSEVKLVFQVNGRHRGDQLVSRRACRKAMPSSSRRRIRKQRRSLPENPSNA